MKSLKNALIRKVAAQRHAKAQKALAANASQGLAIFDQGVENASAIPVVKADALGQGDNAPDMSKPFIVRIDEWVAEINQESSVTRQNVDAFKVMSDTLRAQAKGSRASKLMKELLDGVVAALQDQGAAEAVLPASMTSESSLDCWSGSEYCSRSRHTGPNCFVWFHPTVGGRPRSELSMLAIDDALEDMIIFDTNDHDHVLRGQGASRRRAVPEKGILSAILMSR